MQDSSTNTTAASSILDITAKSISSSLAILPTYYPFVWNGARQLGKPRPSIDINNTVIWPLKGSAILGFVIAIQLTLSDIISGKLKKLGFRDLTAEYSSTLTVAFVTSPGLIADKGRTFGFSIFESFRRSNIKTFAGLTFRESAFLFSDPLGRRINSHLIVYFGENRRTKYLSVAAGGAIGCTMGYAADTLIARSFYNMPISYSPGILYAGLTPKIVGVSGFFCLYTFVMEKLNCSKSAQRPD